jgi:hypothetical protein
MKQVGQNSRAARWLLAAGLVAAVAGLSVTYLTAAGAQTVSATTPRCHTRGLAVWLGVGTGGAQAGSNAYPVEFTNISGTRCQLYGYPGVSAQLAGQQAGSPARRDSAVAPRTVTLAAGATAHTVLQIIDVSALPGCKPVTADGLKVYPPGAVTAAQISFRFRGCSAAGPRFLSVQALQSRVGVPGHS